MAKSTLKVFSKFKTFIVIKFRNTCKLITSFKPISLLMVIIVKLLNFSEMPPPPKVPRKYKAAITDELAEFQNKIQMIKTQPAELAEDVPDETNKEHDYEAKGVEFLSREVKPNSSSSMIQPEESEDLKKFIREQIRQSERRIQHRIERIEQKINRLLEQNYTHQVQTEEELIEEEHLLNVEYLDRGGDLKVEVDELGSLAFPIADEATFDWFFEKLAVEEHRNALIERRWHFTRNVSTKSFNIAVKDFIRMHFDLSVCVKYSVSGFGSHGIRKKKLDSNSLCIYVYECFSRSMPGFNSFQDVNRAIVQFWGRAPDVLNKQKDRALKRGYSLDLRELDGFESS